MAAAGTDAAPVWPSEYDQFAQWALNGAVGGDAAAPANDAAPACDASTTAPSTQAENDDDRAGGARGLHRVAARARFNLAAGMVTSPAAAKVRPNAREVGLIVVARRPSGAGEVGRKAPCMRPRSLCYIDFTVAAPWWRRAWLRKLHPNTPGASQHTAD